MENISNISSTSLGGCLSYIAEYGVIPIAGWYARLILLWPLGILATSSVDRGNTYVIFAPPLAILFLPGY